MNADNRPEPADAEVSVVTATRRLARWLKEEDDRRHVIAGDQAWRPIDVSAWDTWVDATWRRLRDWGSTSVTGTLLSDEQERFLWEQAVADIPAIGAVLMPGQVAREAQAAWKLVTEFGVDRDELAAAGGQATRHLLQAGAFVEERCRDRGWRTRTMRMAQLAGAEGFNHVVTSEVILDSLEEPVPLQRTLLDAIAKTGSRVKHRDRGREGASVVARPCADPQRELESLALAARAWIERNPHARVGIVVQDLEGRRDDVEAIFDDILSPERVLPGRAGQARQWDLSLGKSLSEWPMIATALRALSLCLDEAPYSEMSLLLRAPHIGGVASELADRCRLDAWLRGRGRYEASIERLAPNPHNQRYEGRPACPDLAARLTRIVDQLPGMSGRARPEDWVTRFMALLSLLGWPGFRPLVSAEYQCLDRLPAGRPDSADPGPRPARDPGARLRRLVGGRDPSPGMAETTASQCPHTGLAAARTRDAQVVCGGGTRVCPREDTPSCLRGRLRVLLLAQDDRRRADAAFAAHRRTSSPRRTAAVVAIRSPGQQNREARLGFGLLPATARTG
jgi:hypothetical protein